MMITTFDGFANYIVAQATVGSNFGDHLAQALGLASQAVGSHTLEPQGGFLIGLAGTASSAILAIFIGVLALIASFVEFLLMVFRGGVLVILCGVIPLAAAFSNIPAGERWLRRISGWIVALALYKLAAALCYAAAFRLTAGTDVIGVMDGLGLLIVSVVALPVLLRLTLPAAEHFTLHRGAAASTRVAVGALPTGAVTTLAATGGATGAAMATGMVSHQTAGAANGAGHAPGAASGASAGHGSGPARASRNDQTGSSGSAEVRTPRSRGLAGGDGAAGSAGAGEPASPTAGEGSRGGGITRATSTSFGIPGSAGSRDQDTSSRPARPSGAPEGGTRPEPVEGSREEPRGVGEAPAGGSAAPHRSPRMPVDEPKSSSKNPTGTDESGSGG
jgi:hypothetical protein